MANRTRNLAQAAALAIAAALVAAAPRAHAAELIVTDQSGGRVVVLDATSGAYKRTLWSSPDFVQPSALTLGPGGDLFFVNRVSQEVLRIPAANLGQSNVTATPFVTNIAYPGSITYHAPTDALLIGEFGLFPEGPLGDNIFVYNGAAQLQATLTLPQVGIAGLAFNNGDLYASGFITDEFGSGRVYKFNGPPTWTSQDVFAPNPAPSPILQGAAGLAFDSTGNLYVAGLVTFNAGNVLKFTVENGQVVGENQVGDLTPFPSGLLTIDDNQLLVTSLGFGPTSGTLYRFNTATGARSTILAGDFNDDAVVDALDLEVWRTAIAANDGSADADFDGDSDGNDFLAWQRGLGNTGPPGLYSPSAVILYSPPTVGAVPEPTAAWLVLAATIGTRALRCRRRPAA
jgi:hypothetical protein